MELRVVFQNIYQGMLFAGEKENKSIFYKYNPSAYINYYRNFKPNIVCLAEVPFDDENGNGVFIEKFSKELGLSYLKTYVNEKSWIVEDKYYGTAIFSKFPIKHYESFNLPNPKLEIDHKDGTRWLMHDKGAQKFSIELEDLIVNVFNLHYFPFHHFNRKINEPEFENIRKALADILLPNQNEASLICGDFNNRGVEIEDAFTELFKNEELKRAITFNGVEFEQDFEGYGTQIDHILYTPKFLDLVSSKVEPAYSDHVGLSAIFKPK